MKVNKTTLGKVALTSGLVLLTFFDVSAQEVDPFAAIFGDAPRARQSENNNEAHKDNIQVVSMQLRDHDLIDVITGYAISDDLCIEATAVFEALKLPLNISGDRLSGWIGEKNKTVDINLTNGKGTIFDRAIARPRQIKHTPQGWCLSLSLLTDLTEIDFTYEQTTLMVTASPRKTLPIEAKLERARLREEMQFDQDSLNSNYAVIETPYKWLSFPAADVNIDISAGAKSPLNKKFSIELAGDFLKTTARFRSVDNSGSGQTLRATLSRVSEHADQLGPLRARQFSIGDISTPALPLSTKSKTGRGAIISNVSIHRPTLFDTTEIIGALPQGWEAELYEGQRLLGFTDTADTNGNYVFSDVPLQLGYNRLIVKLFGPYGEVKERSISQFVGGAQCPDNELRYLFGIIDPHETRSEATAYGRTLSAVGLEAVKGQDESAPYSIASVEYGLSQNFSARLDASHYFQSGDYNAALSVLGSFNSMHGGVRIASDETGARAYEAFVQARLSQKSSLSAHWSEFGQLSSEYSGEGPSRLMQEGRIRFNTNITARRYVLPVQANLTWTARENGEANLSAQTVTASNYKGVNWSHTLSYYNTQSPNSKARHQMDGSLIASKNLKGFRMRTGLNYGFTKGFEINSLSASIQRSFKNQGVFQASTVYDMKSKAVGLDGSFSKSFRQFTVSTSAGINQSGNWKAGINIAFSLYKPKASNFYSMAKPGLSRSGALRLLSFEDLDGDGRQSAGDIETKGSKYVISNSLRSETADDRGVSIISGIEPYKSTNIELQISSLEDPFLRPVQAGRAVTLRPGQVVDVHVPLVTTGDIDGFIKLEKGDNSIALAGVRVEIVGQDGRVIQTSLSEYDGYFYVADIPAVTVYARIAQEDLDMIEGQREPIMLDLTRENPTASNVALTIKSTAS